jgi:ribosomal protein S18 acetylase RimI-like enzyme
VIDVEFTIRNATEADLPAIQAALAHALDWRGVGGWESPVELIESSGHAYLLADWGRSGDVAVIADACGRAVGAAWCRRWTEALHSYGYVDDATPEIGLGVDPDYRRRGVGSALMTRLLAVASRRGVGRLSLSVECDNPAVDLYRSLGFEHHADVDNAWTMCKQLAS